jgi:hypothetical protein
MAHTHLIVYERKNPLTNEFCGFDFVSTNYTRTPPPPPPPPTLVGKDDVSTPPNLCCGTLLNGRKCKKKAKYTKALDSGRWFCGSHLYNQCRAYEYKATHVREQIQCAICHEDIALTDNSTKTKCSHTFHSECLNRWKSYKSNCPMCRNGLFDRNSPANHLLINNYYHLSKALKLNMMISKDVITHLNSKSKDSKLSHDMMELLDSYEQSNLLYMYNKVIKTINERPDLKKLFH